MKKLSVILIQGQIHHAFENQLISGELFIRMISLLVSVWEAQRLKIWRKRTVCSLSVIIIIIIILYLLLFYYIIYILTKISDNFCMQPNLAAVFFNILFLSLLPFFFSAGFSSLVITSLILYCKRSWRKFLSGSENRQNQQNSWLKRFLEWGPRWPSCTWVFLSFRVGLFCRL